MADFMNKNRIITKMAGTLTVAVVITNTAMPVANVYAADISAEQKEEVVYVMTDASGKTDSVNVVNIFGRGSVTDYGDYSNVKMLNSTEKITRERDKVTFTTDSDRVYYQGTLDAAKTPWNISITYKLDGKTVTPEKLAGKDGKLEMHIAITKNDSCTTDFYDSYALQATFTFDTDRCKNIVADGATLANVGSNKQISYTILPGKGLDADIAADITDFEMDAAAINGIKLNLNVDVDDSELTYKVEEIQDATKKLNDGAATLSDGSGKLTEGGSSLVSGADTLNSGAATLNQGISSLDSGVKQMQSALDTLNSKSKNLTDGSANMLTALKTIQSQLADVSVSTSQLKQLTDSSSAIKTGINDAYNGAVGLQSALEKNLSYDSYKAVMKAKGLDLATLQAGNTQAISSLSQQIDKLSASVTQLKSIPGYESNEQYVTQVTQLEAQIAGLKQVVTLLNGNNAAIGSTKTYLDTLADGVNGQQGMNAGVNELVNGLNKLNTNYEGFDKAIITLSNTLSGMAVNVSRLKSAIDQLVNKYENLESGVEQYTAGVSSIVSAYSKIVEGTNSLAGGSRQLVSGSQTLKTGSSDLYNGIISLDDGTKELFDGTKEFYEKTADMDTQVQEQIDGMLDEISGGDEPVVSFVSDKNTNVKDVQFVIKTAVIEKENQDTTKETTTQRKSFWQKLKDLFS